MGLVRLDWLHLYKYHLGGSAVYSVSYFDISSFILNILRLNEGFSFGMKGGWWCGIVRFMLWWKVVLCFFLLGFFPYVTFLYLTGRLVLRHIGVFGYFLLVCRCAFFFYFPLSECLSKARRHLSCFFTFGVWPVGFAWSSEEKKTFLCGILLSIVVLGICPNRARFNFWDIYILFQSPLLSMHFSR